MKILVINGPNINMLGIREPQIYGTQNYQNLISFIKDSASTFNVECECYQSNHEGAIIDKIQAAYGIFDGIVINPAAYTHTSIAIADAIKALNIPTVEVHISDISKREPFRQISYVSDVCVKTYSGLGFEGYKKAIQYIISSK